MALFDFLSGDHRKLGETSGRGGIILTERYHSDGLGGVLAWAATTVFFVSLPERLWLSLVLSEHQDAFAASSSDHRIRSVNGERSVRVRYAAINLGCRKWRKLFNKRKFCSESLSHKSRVW